VTAWRLSREKPDPRDVGDAVFTEKKGYLFRKNRTAVFAAFSGFDIHRFAGKIDVFLL
jgi:hypothetical protein